MQPFSLTRGHIPFDANKSSIIYLHELAMEICAYQETLGRSIEHVATMRLDKNTVAFFELSHRDNHPRNKASTNRSQGGISAGENNPTKHLPNTAEASIILQLSRPARVTPISRIASTIPIRRPAAFYLGVPQICPLSNMRGAPHAQLRRPTINSPVIGSIRLGSYRP